MRKYPAWFGKRVTEKGHKRILLWYLAGILLHLGGAYEKGQDMYLVGCLPYFWGTLKEEGIGQEIFPSRKEAKAALFDYIEVFYNRRRRHSSLEYLSPVDFEKH